MLCAKVLLPASPRSFHMQLQSNIDSGEGGGQKKKKLISLEEGTSCANPGRSETCGGPRSEAEITWIVEGWRRRDDCGQLCQSTLSFDHWGPLSLGESIINGTALHPHVQLCVRPAAAHAKLQSWSLHSWSSLRCPLASSRGRALRGAALRAAFGRVQSCIRGLRFVLLSASRCFPIASSRPLGSRLYMI